LVAQLVAEGYRNGRLPDEALGAVSGGFGRDCKLVKSGGADLAWSALTETAAIEGVVIEGGYCYRTFQAQAAAWKSRRCYIPGNCDGNPYPPTATPGRSMHGWGLAVDILGASGLLTCSSQELLWLQVRASQFGWVHPEWARCGQSGAEPWHWEYVGTDLLSAHPDTED
jgi:LAS superfamily LD-carboxypeptidase LdcB